MLVLVDLLHFSASLVARQLILWLKLRDLFHLIEIWLLYASWLCDFSMDDLLFIVFKLNSKSMKLLKGAIILVTSHMLSAIN
jgi:hypothetical protein